MLKITATKEKKTGAKFAHQVSIKGGGDEYVADAIVEDIDTMSSRKISLRQIKSQLYLIWPRK